MTSFRSSLPSYARWTDPFLIAFVIIATYALLCRTSLNNADLLLIMSCAVGVVMIGVEIFCASWRKTSRPLVSFTVVCKRASIKWVGIMLGLSIIVFVWWLLPEYQLSRHKTLRYFLPKILYIVPFLTAVWVLYTEWRLGPEEDGNWYFGLMALCRFKEVKWDAVRLALMGWVVRGFFLPLNIGGGMHYIRTIRGKEDTILSLPWPEMVTMLDNILFGLLVVAIIPGYVFSARLLGTSFKKVDQTWFGWAVTLFCYPPVNVGTRYWFSYSGRTPALSGDPWAVFTSDLYYLSIVLGCAILLFELLHYWGESICCLRSSHLSSRGTITNGPFTLTKHPVYISKCFLWFVWTMPFYGGPNIEDNIRRTIIFFMFCMVYVMRGWVEERLLSEDPAYVAYGLFMDKQSIFRFMGNWIPLLKYEYRLQRWIKNGIIDPSVLSASKLSP